MTAFCILSLLCELRAQNITAIISNGIPAEQRLCRTKILWTKIAKSLTPPPLPNVAAPQVQPPTLHGLVIGDFVIEGIDDDANRVHARLFYKQLLPMMQNSGPSWK